MDSIVKLENEWREEIKMRRRMFGDENKIAVTVLEVCADELKLAIEQNLENQS